MTERTAIITGGSRGIGFAVADEFVRRGIDVSICARSEDDLLDARRKLSDEEGNVNTVTGDVASVDDCSDVVESTMNRFGRLDILVNNAGIGMFTPVRDMEPEQWNRTIDVNLNGAFYMTREALPHLLNGDGTSHVFFMSSLAGKNTFAGASAYCASKFGLNALAECLMQEERHNDIKVTSVAPGSVDTEFSSEDKSQWALVPEDVAKTIVNFLDERKNAHSSYVEMRPFQPPEE